MHKPLKKLLYFLLFPLLLWAIAYFHFQAHKGHLYTQLTNADQAIATAPDTFPYLVAGHSRLLRGIDTTLWPGVIKVGTPGESFIETYYKLKYVFEKEGKHPEYVLLPFEMGTFKPNDFRRSFYWKKYINFFEVGWQKRELPKFLSACIFAYVFPFRDYYYKQIKNQLDHWAGVESSTVKINKQQKTFGNYTLTEQNQIINEDISFLKQIGMMDQSAPFFVQKTIELCQQYQVQLIYVKCPLTKAYEKELENLAYHQNYQEEKLTALIEQNENTSLIDFGEAFDSQNHYFFDQHHLNETGSRVFTKLLQQKLY